MNNRIKIDTSSLKLHVENLVLPCRIGMGGTAPLVNGREGDRKTPLGEYALRFGLYRADRLPAPRSNLPFRPLRENDGWCDESGDPAYNRFIRLPSDLSHEKLWREDGAYDIILVISHNDSPPVPNMGSAVFIHVAQADDRKTMGCIALPPEQMVRLLPRLQVGQHVHISR